MTDWYTASGNPTQGSAGASNVLRSEYNSIAAAFSKMPPLTGYNGLLVGVNSSGTALSTYSYHEVLLALNAAELGTNVSFATINGTTITASSQFSGPGTGLTGTAASLSIGGNAATATNATNATNATTSTTAPQFDNDTSIATTAFVQRALGNLAGVAAYGVNTVLTTADAGKWIAPTTTSLTFTLPLVSASPAGTTIIIYGNASGVTVQRQGTDTFYYGGSLVTSVTLAGQDLIQVMSNGSAWYLINFTSTFTGTGSIVKADSPALTGNPTAPTPSTGDNDTSIATTAFVNANCVGLGQTWQDVTGSRSAGTVYTNSTGRPIQVSVIIVGTGAAQGSITLNGTATAVSSITEAVNATHQYTFIIPNSQTYLVTLSAGTIQKWLELR